MNTREKLKSLRFQASELYTVDACHDVIVGLLDILIEATDNCRDLRSVLGEIVELDHHNHGPESRATKITRDALNQSVQSN